MVDSQPIPENGNVLKHRVFELEKDGLKRDAMIKQAMNECSARDEKLEERIRVLEVQIASMQERLTIFQLAQGVWTTIAATAAAIFGRTP